MGNTPFLGKFGPKNQNCQFELEFSTYANLNMQNSKGMFTFSIFDRKYLFLGKFRSKNQNCQFELNFGTKTNSNMHNSMVMLTFSVLTKNTLFGQILIQKTKIVQNFKIFILSWNLVPRLFRICKIWWWCSLFLF